MSLNDVMPINGNYDQFVRQCIENAPASRVAWYLTASYAYYIRDESLLSDQLYDEICKWLCENLGSINHIHSHFLSKEMLSCGTGFHLKLEDYPSRVVLGGDTLIRNLHTAINMSGNNQLQLFSRMNCRASEVSNG